MTSKRFTFDPAGYASLNATTVFRVGSYENLLLGSLTPGGWSRIAKDLIEKMASLPFADAEKGSFLFPNFTFAGYGVEVIPFDVASEVVSYISDGALEYIAPEYTRYGKVQFTTALRREAFALHFGEEHWHVNTQRDGAATGVSEYYLRTTIETFANFRTSSYYRTRLRSAMRNRTGVVETREDVTRTAQQQAASRERFEKFIYGIQNRLAPSRTMSRYVNDPVLPGLPTLTHGTLASRRWGIEIEAVDIAGITTPSGWELHDDGSLRGRNSYGDGDGEYCDECGEYHGDCNGEYDTETGEWTSPILKSWHSRGLEHLTDELDGRYSNDSAGIHVHVDAADLTLDQAARVALIYTAWEPLFEHEYQREEREYCQSLSPRAVIERFSTMRNLKREGKKVTDIHHFERYVVVNLNALSAHGTIEFRAMGPRYEYDTLTKWAMFLREIVNIAKADVPQRVWSNVSTFEDVVAVFQKYGKETPGAEIEELSVPTEQAEDQGVTSFTSIYGDYAEEYNDDYSGIIDTTMMYA